MHTQKNAPNQPVHNDGVQQNDNKTQFIKKRHDILRRLVFDIGQKLYKYINLKGGDQPIDKPLTTVCYYSYAKWYLYQS